jgi:GxxExxY protein
MHQSNKEEMESINGIIASIIEDCIEIHALLGEGLRSADYQQMLYQQVQKRGLFVQRNVPVFISYEKLNIEVALKAEFIVENTIICDIKTVDVLLPVHKKDLATFLRLANKQVGLLINFKERRVKNGIVKLVNKNYHSLY